MAPSAHRLSAAVLALLTACGPAGRSMFPDAATSDAGVASDAAVTDAAPDPDASSDGGLDIDAQPVADGGRDGGVEVDAAAADAGGGTDAAASDGGGSPTGEHLLISEVCVQPNDAEFFEIWNPTAGTIALDDTYVSDNSTYTSLAAGTPWTPITANAGSDFLVGFPSGSTIGPNAVAVVAMSAAAVATLARCPEFVLASAPVACPGGGSAAPMRTTESGSFTAMTTLSNAREMLVLFRWAGVAGTVGVDLDYVTWGDMFEAGSRADKTGVAGYQPDTAVASQHAAPAPGVGESAVRCGGELGETLTGGNGTSGHDETSERLDLSFRALPSSPGTHPACP